MSKLKNLTGQKFGRLTVIEMSERKNNQTMWLCRCDCGNEINVCSNSLSIGDTKSCGCLRRECTSKRRTTHNEFGTRLYKIWAEMKQRVLNPNHPKYKNYGGRGIEICDEWKDYIQFAEWSRSNGYAEDLTIDRIDVNKSYCPENCRWVPQKVQQNNRSNNKKITAFGETLTLAQWADKMDLPYTALYLRLYRRHWDIDKALTTPLRKCSKDNNGGIA